MTWKSYAAFSGAGLLATYLFSAPPTVTDRVPVSASPTGAAASRVVDDIEQQAARLGSRVRPSVDYEPPARNPFRFGGRPRSFRGTSSPPMPTQPPVEAAIPDLPPLPPPPPPVRLTGIATTTVDGQRQRSAVLLTPDGVVSAREGDMAGAYRVVRIDEDAVDVLGPDGTPRRLQLRP
jgi:hypothetical protein